jgi:hypothetical protein
VGLNLDTPWTAAANVVNELIDRLVPDKAEAEKQKAIAAQALQAQTLAYLQASVTVDQSQTATNTAEAQSSSKWASGWRPYIGWVCGTGLLYAMLGQPVLSWVMGNAANWKPAPTIDMGTLIPVLCAMLGIATQRTIERIQGKVPPGK